MKTTKAYSLFVVALLLASIALPASAATINATLSAGMFTTQAGATTIDFDSLSASTIDPYISGIASYTGWSAGNAPFVNGSASGQWAAPPGDETEYLTIGSSMTGMVTISFAAPITYFGFYMGSPDAYNRVSLYDTGGSLIQSYSGDQLIAPGNGDQSLGAYVNFNVSGGTVGKVVLSSTQAALETDNHSYVAAASAPEPLSLVLLGAGLVALGVFGRRRRQV